MRHWIDCCVCVVWYEILSMSTTIKLIEALTELLEAMTVRLSELEQKLKQSECSCEKWRKERK